MHFAANYPYIYYIYIIYGLPCNSPDLLNNNIIIDNYIFQYNGT